MPGFSLPAGGVSKYANDPESFLVVHMVLPCFASFRLAKLAKLSCEVDGVLSAS